MSLSYARRFIWDMAVELAFDCVQVGMNFPNRKNNPILERLNESASLLVSHIRRDLKRMSRYGEKESYFETAQHFLSDMELQIQIANGLGFLKKARLHKFQRRISALEKLMEVKS